MAGPDHRLQLVGVQVNSQHPVVHGVRNPESILGEIDG
jgi:hypothetical protein